MKRTLFALPALAILFGVGGTATVYAQDLGPGTGLSDDQRDSLDTLRDLMHDGRIDEAKAFAQAHGLTSLKHGPPVQLDPETYAALEAALENNDYEAFVQLTADAPFADDLTPDAFAQLVEAHTLMEAGDMDGARAILQDLHLPLPGLRREMGHAQPHRLMRELTDEQKDLLDQARKLHQSGDDEGAQAILDALDLPHPPMRRFDE